MLNREPMWLKLADHLDALREVAVSVLNREPMWLKYARLWRATVSSLGFSAQP